VEDRVNGIWGSLARTTTHRFSVWKFNWIVNHRILAALERTRGHARGVLLDVGCGDKAFARLFAGRIDRYLGVDLPSSSYPIHPDLFARAEALPLPDASVDTVLGISIMTYVPDPMRVLEEVRRVLRPDGRLLMEFPQMAALNDEPNDYFRFTRFGADSLLERAGFEPIEHVEMGGLWTAVGLQLIAGLNRINRGPWRLLTELPVRALYVSVQVFFAFLDRVFFTRRWVLAHLVVARPAPSDRPRG
jgi:SAM-dependent methyltransferase